MSRIGQTLAVLAVAALLSGCKGDAAPRLQQKLMIFASGVDCSTSGGLKWEECMAAIDQAVLQHEARANRYRNFRLCEATEGVDRCERNEDGTWRPRPVGYLFTLVEGRAPMASVLYAGDRNTTTFRAPDGRTFNPDQPGDVVFSKAAEKRAEGFVTTRAGRRS